MMADDDKHIPGALARHIALFPGADTIILQALKDAERRGYMMALDEMCASDPDVPFVERVNAARCSLAGPRGGRVVGDTTKSTVPVPLPDLTKDIFLVNSHPARYANGRLGQLNDDYPSYVYNSDGLMLRSLYGEEWSRLLVPTGGEIPGEAP